MALFENGRALQIFSKVSKLREEVKGFGNRHTMVCNLIKSSLQFKLNQQSEAKELVAKLLQYSRICLARDD